MILAFFVPFLALLFPMLVADDYKRTRALARSGAHGVTDPARRPRDRDAMFWGPGALWIGSLLAIPAARATGHEGLAMGLIVFQLLSFGFSLGSMGLGWLGRDKRTDEERQEAFCLQEAQVQAYFDRREAQRVDARVAYSEPPVPWVARQVWRRWFLVRWGPHGWDGDPAGPPLGLDLTALHLGGHATPVTEGERVAAPIESIVGAWRPRRAGGSWKAAPAPSPAPLDVLHQQMARTPSPFRFPGISWPVCDDRLAVLVWEGNAGLSPDAIGLPMGLPARIEQLVVAAQGQAPWRSAHGWDLNAVFQCAECGRLYWRGYEP